jgi:hypothetical protein
MGRRHCPGARELPYPRAVRSLAETIAPPALACLAAAVLAGCGGTYTKRDFIARADAICAGAVRETRAIAPPAFSGTGAQRISALAQYLARCYPWCSRRRGSYGL